MIELINVNKTYKTKKRTTKALVDCNLSFPEKGLFFLTGESGSGKSTFLRIVSMQDSDFKGKLLMQGRDAQSLSFAERASFRASFFGFVSQDLDLIDALTVRENLTLAKDMTGEETEEREVLNILSRLDLPKDILDEKPENLSGGQRQRVAIGRALLKDCKVLACDEPTGNLDDDNAESVMKTLKDLSSERLVLVASHNPYLAEKYADAIIHFEEGVVESFKMGSNDADVPAGFTTKKSSLQPKTAFKLAVSTLKSSTKKLVFAGVSTVLATSFMLSTFSLHEFNMDFAMQNAIANEGVKSFRVRKSIRESIHYSHYEKMNESDIEKARTFFPSVAAYFDYPGGIEHLYRKTPSTGEWVVASVQNVNLIDASTFKLDDFSFPLIGSLPKQGEVLLTRYQLVEWGIVDPGASFDAVALARAQEHGFNFEDTVRNEVKMMAVSGIVDTGYPFFAPKKTENTHYQQKVASCYIEEMHGNALISHEDALVFQKDLIEFERKTSVPYGGFFVSAEKTKVKDVETFSKMLQENDPKARARASTRFSSSYTSLSAFQSNWETTLMLVGTVLSLFSLFFFGSFLLSVTSNNRDAWTILFNLGAKKWDVYKVLLMQSALISAGTVIVSLVPYGFGILGIDLYMNHVLSSAFFPLTLSYIGFFASLGVLLLVGALASWVALLGLRGKKNKKN